MNSHLIKMTKNERKNTRQKPFNIQHWVTDTRLQNPTSNRQNELYIVGCWIYYVRCTCNLIRDPMHFSDHWYILWRWIEMILIEIRWMYHNYPIWLLLLLVHLKSKFLFKCWYESRKNIIYSYRCCLFTLLNSESIPIENNN